MSRNPATAPNHRGIEMKAIRLIIVVVLSLLSAYAEAAPTKNQQISPVTTPSTFIATQTYAVRDVVTKTVFTETWTLREVPSQEAFEITKTPSDKDYPTRQERVTERIRVIHSSEGLSIAQITNVNPEDMDPGESTFGYAQVMKNSVVFDKWPMTITMTTFQGLKRLTYAIILSGGKVMTVIKDFKHYMFPYAERTMIIDMVSGETELDLTSIRIDIPRDW